MSQPDSTSGITPAAQEAATAGAQATGAATPNAPAAPGGAATPAQVASLSSLHSLAEFKEKAPEVYNQMMLSIGSTITTEMQKHQDRLKTLWRQASADAQR